MALNNFLSGQGGLEAQKEMQLPASLAGLAGNQQNFKNFNSIGPPGPSTGPAAGPVGVPPPRPQAPAIRPPVAQVRPPVPAPAPQPPAGGGLSAAASAAAAAMGPGKKQVQFEIRQEKVATVLGKNGSTLNAIKTYSKANFFIDQHVPEEEKARIYVVGSDREIMKCKQTVLAVVDGSMSLATLCSLAGVPMPRDDEPERGGKGHAAPHVAAPFANMATPAPFAQMPPPAMPPAMPPAFPGMPPGMPPPPGVGIIPGMPENQQMQQNLNDYYARMWSTYAQQQAAGSAEMQPVDAFDKDALAKLAERAANAANEPPPTPPPQPSTQPAWGPPPPEPGGADPNMALQADLADRMLAGMAPPAPGSEQSAPAAAQTGPAEMAPFQPMELVNRSRVPENNVTLQGFLRPNAEPAKPQKDADSVQKMLERLQGNVQQTREAVAMGEDQMRMRSAQMRASGQGFDAFREDSRTRADFEFEAMIQRMQSAQAPEEIENVGREVLIKFSALTPPQVTEMLQKMSSATGLQSHQNGDFLAEICRVIIPRLKEFTSTQFTSLTSTFASWSAGDKKRRSSRFQEFSKGFFNAASLEMSSRLMTFAPHELNCCLAAFVSVGFSEHKFFAGVGRAALARHSSFAPVQLTALLAILSEMRLLHTDLFNAAATFLSTRAKELRPVDILRVLRSFAKCGLQHQGLCKATGDEVVSRMKDKSTAASFKIEDLCEIVWAHCVLSHFHEGLVKVLFKALERAPMISSDALCQLYESHLALDAEHTDAYSRYRPHPDEIQDLQDHYKDARKDERRCSEKQRSDVASALKSLVDGSVHVNHRTSTGLLVDVAALRKRSSTDGFIHVDLDSNVTVVRSLDQDEPSVAALVVEGAVAMRRRLLIKGGLRLVTVRESEWRDLDDSKDKRRYLRSLLSNIGDVLE